MTGRPIKPKISQMSRAARAQPRRPFWYSAVNYYMLAGAACVFLFFVGWGILHDMGDEVPWITSGIGASMMMVGAVLMREAVLKRSHINAAPRDAQMERHLGDMYARVENARSSDKLTIERNAALVRDITRKSDAAEVLGSFGAVHREIFELCDAYLAKNDLELRHIGAGSPRLGPLRKGRDTVGRYHRYHLLRWAEIETGSLNRQAREKAAVQDKVEAAHAATGIVDYALGFYPDDRSLIESRAALREITVSFEVSVLLEDAEHAVFQGNLKEARRYYRDALFRLGRESSNNESRELTAGRILTEIEKLDRAEDAGDPGTIFTD